MIKALRKRHLQIWTAWAVLIPIGIVSAIIVRSQFSKDKLLQPAATAALPMILKSADKTNYTVNIRSNSDTSQLQLEWINKKALICPTATIYEDTMNRNSISNALLIGRIEARGTYHFQLNKNLVRNNYHFILYDFIHQKIIDSITFLKKNLPSLGNKEEAMGASYLAVGWNRQKKIYDWLIFAFCAVYLTTFIVLTTIFNPDYTFETVLIRSTSTLALILLHVILSIGPLTRINKKFLPLLYNRRHLGVTMFCIIVVHGAFGILQFHSLGNVNPFVSLFTSNTHFGSLADFPFQALGFFALIIFFLMAITSHDFWLHNLSPKVWKTLHMFVYLAYFLVVMHVMLGVIQYETNPVFIIIMAVGTIILITLHLIAGTREVKKDNIIYPSSIAGDNRLKGFVKVCNVNDILEDRAKMFCIKDERIAVFKTGGKLFAVSNVCKHQNGPLGEGKVLDGCITCPWHGYQYLPHNGQSPPFKEKVSTYDVKLEGNDVWLNPLPYPEGTGRPGAMIEMENVKYKMENVKKKGQVS